MGVPVCPCHAMPCRPAAGLTAGALAGNPFGVDRKFLSHELGFEGRVCPNSMDAGTVVGQADQF